MDNIVNAETHQVDGYELTIFETSKGTFDFSIYQWVEDDDVLVHSSYTFQDKNRCKRIGMITLSNIIRKTKKEKAA